MWVALVGPRGAGRGGIARRLEAALEDAELRVGGFRQESVGTPGRRHSGGYDLVRVGSEERVPLARKSAEPELCDWAFAAESFERARGWLQEPCDVHFATAGRLEAAGRGHWPAIARAAQRPGLLVLSLRPGVLAAIALRLPDPEDALELPAGEPEISGFILRTVALARR